MTQLAIILGSGRNGRRSEAVARFLFGECSKRDDCSAEFVDVRDHARPVTNTPWETGEAPPAWHEIASRTDAYIIVTPEYNHGYPGELKILLDSLESKAYKDKPALIAGVSSGRFGGGRVIEHIKPVLIELGMVPLGVALSYFQVGSAFDDAGNPTDPKLAEIAGEGIKELLRYSGALSSLRK